MNVVSCYCSREASREQEEIRREQRLMQKELEKRAKFETIENDKENPRGLEKFDIDKSKEN